MQRVNEAHSNSIDTQGIYQTADLEIAETTKPRTTGIDLNTTSDLIEDESSLILGRGCTKEFDGIQ